MTWKSFLSYSRRVALFPFILVLAAQVALTQTSTTGAIRGTVTDSQGAVIVGVSVKVT